MFNTNQNLLKAKLCSSSNAKLLFIKQLRIWHLHSGGNSVV